MRKSRSNRKRPGISTASLPDIIFMLLFFFMVVTVLRNDQIKLKILIPDASETQKLSHASRIQHVHIGKPHLAYSKKVNETKIQIGDAFCPNNKLELAIGKIKSSFNEEQKVSGIWSLHIDENTEMGIVAEVKKALRKNDELRINYAANKRME